VLTYTHILENQSQSPSHPTNWLLLYVIGQPKARTTKAYIQEITSARERGGGHHTNDNIHLSIHTYLDRQHIYAHTYRCILLMYGWTCRVVC
jgi:hypothetical protein